MLSLMRIYDPKVADGTTAFVMALARKDHNLIRVLLASKHQSDVNPHQLARRAISELDRNPQMSNLKLREVLVSGVQNEGFSISEEYSPNDKYSTE